MVRRISQIRWKEAGALASVYTVFAFTIRQIEAVYTMRYYTDPAYFGLWSRLMMPEDGPPERMFFGVSAFFTFVTGFVLASLYDFVKPVLPKGFRGRVVGFTDVVVALMIVLWLMPAYLLFNVPYGLLVSWLVSGTVTVIFAAILFARYLK